MDHAFAMILGECLNLPLLPLLPLASFGRLREQLHHSSKLRLKHGVGLSTQVLCALARDQERLQAFLNQDKCCAQSFLFARIQGGASGRDSAFWLHST